MWVDEDPDERDPKRARAYEALCQAKAATADRTVPIRINSYTVIWIKPECAADPAYMKRFYKNWETR